MIVRQIPTKNKQGHTTLLFVLLSEFRFTWPTFNVPRGTPPSEEHKLFSCFRPRSDLSRTLYVQCNTTATLFTRQTKARQSTSNAPTPLRTTTTMASSGSGYDLSASTFSPDGRIFQVEYATKAVENAGPVLGIKCDKGVVLGVAKPVNHKMVVATTGSYKRIHTCDAHIGCASTGFLPDARVLVQRTVEEAADWQDQYGSKIPPDVLGERLGAYVHYFTLYGGLRPFGAAAVLAGYDPDTKECSLLLMEPNGAPYKFYGVAAGKGKQAAKTELEKLNLNKEPISVEDAVKQITRILLLLHREQKDAKPIEMELSWICEASGYKHVGVPKDLMKTAEEWAKEQLEEEDEDEEDDDEEEAMEEG